MQLTNIFGIQLLKFPKLQILLFIKQALEQFTQLFNKIHSKLARNKLKPNAYYVQKESIFDTGISDTEFATLNNKALSAGYDQQTAAMIAAEFGSEEILNQVNEFMGIDSKESCCKN